MLNENPNPLPPGGERDWKTQRAVLTLLLFSYPRPLTGKLLKAEIGDPDAVDAAVVELALVGLLWVEGGGLRPTIAARHFDWLEMQ